MESAQIVLGCSMPVIARPGATVIGAAPYSWTRDAQPREEHPSNYTRTALVWAGLQGWDM